MKGIKIILGALAAASLLFSVSANAQENGNRDQNGNVVRGAYETNKAFDNIFIGVAGGVNSVMEQPGKPATWGNFGLAAELNFGKWWTPAIGMRLGWQGLWNNAKNGLDASGVAAGDKFGFNYFHGDLLWNISNSIGGYKETRVWDFIPYATMGVLDVTKTLVPIWSPNLEYAAGVGLLNDIRLSERVDLTLDVKALVAKGAAYSSTASRFAIFPSATVGVVFNLGKTGFDRHSSITPVVIPVPFTTEQYNDLAAKADALEQENGELKEKVNALEEEVAPLRQLVSGQTYLFENGTFTTIDVKPGSPITLYFDCGSATLSAREKAHLEYFANNVVDADTQLVVTGYADKNTGSTRRNQLLSEQRVKTVVDLLTKAGASVDNIETAAYGSSVQLFDGSAKNRVVTIELK